MIFVVSGADSKTGADMTVSIQADDEPQAVAKAKEQGIYPYRIKRDKAAERAEAERTRIAEAARRSEAERIKAAEVAENQRRQTAEIERQMQAFVTNAKAIMRSRLEKGQSVILYHTVYLPVDSVLLDQNLHVGFDIPELRTLGLLGWEAIQAIPRTVGIGLQNSSFGSSMGTTWGAGSGGNVCGVHIIMQKKVCLSDLSDAPDDEVATYIRSNLPIFKPA